ncbi:recombinase family protein [Nocardioides sp. BGMRC 2183]|nr:recombinase family protein [Nocardioides sp. BGMRC 2183]
MRGVTIDSMHNRSAALYVRLSDDRRETGDNVADQIEGARALADRLGLEVVRTYNDNDRPASAGSKPRPAFEQMLADAEAGLFEALVIRTTDRLYRTPADQLRVAETFGPRKMVIHQEWTGHPLDMRDPQGVLISGLMAQVSHYETEVKRKRQRAMNLAAAMRGEPRSGAIPFGYEQDRLTPHPARSAMVQEAYESLLGGASLASVIRDWNATDERAPRGGRWTYSTVRAVLLRPMNAGYVQYDGAILPGVTGRWKPLVSVEDYHAVSALLRDPSRVTAPRGQNRLLKHLLTNLASCGSCGSPMKPGAIKQTRGRLKGKSYPLYRCMNSECSARVSIRRDAANNEVEARFLNERGHLLAWREVVHVVDRGASLADVEARISGTLSQMGEDEADVAALSTRLSELKAERSALRAARPERTVETHGETAAYEWGEADVAGQRDLLRRHLGPGGIRVMRATRHNGNSVDTERILIDWADEPGYTHEFVPTEPISSGEVSQGTS